jgi:hypothetical protein
VSHVPATEGADVGGEVGVVDEGVGVHGEPHGVLVYREQVSQRVQVGDIGGDHLDSRVQSGRNVMLGLADEPTLQPADVLVQPLADGWRRVGKQQPEPWLPVTHPPQQGHPGRLQRGTTGGPVPLHKANEDHAPAGVAVGVDVDDRGRGEDCAVVGVDVVLVGEQPFDVGRRRQYPAGAGVHSVQDRKPAAWCGTGYRLRQACRAAATTPLTAFPCAAGGQAGVGLPGVEPCDDGGDGNGRDELGRHVTQTGSAMAPVRCL